MHVHVYNYHTIAFEYVCKNRKHRAKNLKQLIVREQAYFL